MESVLSVENAENEVKHAWTVEGPIVRRGRIYTIKSVAKHVWAMEGPMVRREYIYTIKNAVEHVWTMEGPIVRREHMYMYAPAPLLHEGASSTLPRGSCDFTMFPELVE